MDSGIPPKPITSTANDRVKALVRLRTRRKRDRSGLVILEEPLVIRRALQAGILFQEIWVCPERHDPEVSSLYKKIRTADATLFEVSEPVMDKIAYRDRSDGLLVLATLPETRLNDLTPDKDTNALYLVLDSVEKPGNLGAILRTADGAGADAVIMTGHAADRGNANCLRASRGAVFAVPAVECTVDEAVDWFRERGITTVAASPEATISLLETDLSGPVALILGAEDRGLDPAWREAADQLVALPMAGIGDSLNVGATAAVLLYEVVRQRATVGEKGS